MKGGHLTSILNACIYIAPEVHNLSEIQSALCWENFYTGNAHTLFSVIPHKHAWLPKKPWRESLNLPMQRLQLWFKKIILKTFYLNTHLCSFLRRTLSCERTWLRIWGLHAKKWHITVMPFIVPQTWPRLTTSVLWLFCQKLKNTKNQKNTHNPYIPLKIILWFPHLNM